MQPPTQPEVPWYRPGIFVTLALGCFLLLLFAGHTAYTAARPLLHRGPSTAATPTPTTTYLSKPLVPALSSNTTDATVQLPTNESVVYQQGNAIYSIPLADQGNAKPTPASHLKPIVTPGYAYNRSAPPMLTPSGQLIYSGNGIWQTAVHNGHAQQIAPLPTGQVITSLALSSDGSTLAWSTAPANGQGNISLYIDHLGAAPQRVYQQPASPCPCFRVFSFANASANSTLLLTNDQGDHGLVQLGLWKLDLNQGQQQQPIAILPSDSQGPLALLSPGNTLLYSNKEMLAPFPADRSIPNDFAAQLYANSLAMAQLDLTKNTLQTPQQILSPQTEQSNVGNYRWADTPTFSPDGQTLVYVLFSSDAQQPYVHHNALYTLPVKQQGNYKQQTTQQPQLLATTSTSFVQFGPWLNNTTPTFYADGSLYALDVTNGATARLATTGTYMRIIGTL